MSSSTFTWVETSIKMDPILQAISQMGNKDHSSSKNCSRMDRMLNRIRQAQALLERFWAHASLFCLRIISLNLNYLWLNLRRWNITSKLIWCSHWIRRYSRSRPSRLIHLSINKRFPSCWHISNSTSWPSSSPRKKRNQLRRSRIISNYGKTCSGLAFRQIRCKTWINSSSSTSRSLVIRKLKEG